MTEIRLPGLRAMTPIGFLAALGAFRHASAMPEFGNVRLSWSSEGGAWIACLSTEHAVDEELLLGALVRRVCDMGERPEFEWSGQIKKSTVQQFREVVFANPGVMDWFVAFGSDLGLAKDGTLKSTDFDMTGGQQKFLQKLRDASRALASSAKEARVLLREALFGPWLYSPSRRAAEAENSHSMGLDPSTLLQGAFTAEEPADIKDKRGVRGAIWLAFEALPLFPCMVSDGWLRTAGFSRQKQQGEWKTYFEWGVWRQPLSYPSVQTLLLQSRNEWTPMRGIVERFRSERVNLNKDYYSLAEAELIV